MAYEGAIFVDSCLVSGLVSDAGEHRTIFLHELQFRGESGVRGVNFDKRVNKYYGRIYVNGKQMFLGYFETLSGAESAVRKARLEHQPFYNDRL